jgi:hypothetical protein
VCGVLDNILHLSPLWLLGIAVLPVFLEDAIFIGFLVPGETAVVLAGAGASLVFYYTGLPRGGGIADRWDGVGPRSSRATAPRQFPLRPYSKPQFRQTVEATLLSEGGGRRGSTLPARHCGIRPASVCATRPIRHKGPGVERRTKVNPVSRFGTATRANTTDGWAGGHAERGGSMTRRSGRLLVALVFLASVSGLAQGIQASSPAAPGAPQVALRIDPRLILEAAEVWELIAGPENRIWPGWNASDTPILFYLPGEQDVLINHPRPPAGFVPYDGPVRFPGGRILVRSGASTIQSDGQNTSIEIEGVPTLVVADPLSNLRQRMRFLLEESRPSAEKAQGLSFSELSTDPYDQLAFIVHEAFHVYQRRAAPAKGANEMLLLHYPVLSAENNVGFAQEGDALAAVLRSQSPSALRAAVVRWLAVRRQRRSTLPAEAVEYEDGVEFSEGLAKYAEYRLFEALEGRKPRPEMWWAQGFRGYGDLTAQRADLVDRMVRQMRGTVLVNNDPYGTAPVRMRLYYSGMAIGVVLDRLSAKWKDRILRPEVSLTALVEDAVGAGGDELRRALEDVRRDPDYDALVAEKKRLNQEGRARIDAMVAQIERGSGTGVVVDYAALSSPRVALAFTPFGITAVDENRTIFTQVPIRARFDDGSEVVQTQPMPLLQDKKRRVILFRLARELSPEEVARATSSENASSEEARAVKIELPGFTATSSSAVVQWDGKDLRIILRQPSH